MRSSSTKILALVSAAFSLAGCSLMNNLTVGKNNMIGIEQAIDCKLDEALASFDREKLADEEGYRRMSYLLSAAIYDEQGKQALWEENLAKFKADEKIHNRDHESFMTDMNDFKKYFKKKRLEKTGDCGCP